MFCDAMDGSLVLTHLNKNVGSCPNVLQFSLYPIHVLRKAECLYMQILNSSNVYSFTAVLAFIGRFKALNFEGYQMCRTKSFERWGHCMAVWHCEECINTDYIAIV
ncbi:hypothetical protein ACFX2I_008806 [Malus domestica]